MTTSQRNKGNVERGKNAERDLARYLREHGWPKADRAVKTGYCTPGRTVADPGDISGCPGIVISVKDVAEKDQTISAWMVELEAMADPNDQVGGLGLLVVKHRGHASPGEWWCWMRLDSLHEITCWTTTDPPISRALVRLALGDVVPLLHRAGYVREVAGT